MSSVTYRDVRTDCGGQGSDMRVTLVCTLCGGCWAGDARLDGTPCPDERCAASGGELSNVDDSELLLPEGEEAIV